MKRKIFKTDMPQRENSRKWTKILFIATAILLAFLLFSPLQDILAKLLNGLIPFFVALLVVFVLKEPRKFLANKLFANKFTNSKNPQKTRMTVSLIIVFLLFLAIIVGIFVLVAPKIINIVEDLITNSQQHLEKLKTQLVDFVGKIGLLKNLISANTIEHNINELAVSISNLGNDLPSLIAKIGSQLLNFFSLLLLGLVFGFLILLNLEKYKLWFKKWFSTFNSPTRTRYAVDFVHTADRIFVDYGFSKLIEGVIILMSVTIALIICGSAMPFELALLMAFLNVIPYVGPIIALVPILLINIVLKDITIALISTLVSAVVVIFVTSFITPLIVGKKIKLDIFSVLLSLTIGGAIFGAIGMIFAPPFTALLIKSIKDSITIRELNQTKQKFKSHSKNLTKN